MAVAIEPLGRTASAWPGGEPLPQRIDDIDPELLRQRFGAVLRRCRCDAGLSTDGLGERCGLHRDEICKLEKAHREPKLSTIVKLARGLQVPSSYLLALVEASAGEGR